jgi:predicted metal-dependent phosphoesterase TrpH
MHTSWSFDCAIPRLVDRANRRVGVAVTDHNVFGGALETADIAQGRELVVIPGEEVKTDGQGG